jgi:cytochrome c biogenesis protein CcmG, thiol:disulfide interchange protein DsbE
MAIQGGRLGLIIAGIGLIVLGGASALLLRLPAADESQVATDFAAVPAAVSFKAPSLNLKDLDGAEHALVDYLGQVVLVNLWATWCPPCQAEMPLLQEYYEQHRADGFVVIAIEDGEPAADVIQFARTYHLTFPVWLDPTYIATDQAFKTTNLPSSYVIDRGGQVRLMWFGAISYANLEKYVTALVRER